MEDFIKGLYSSLPSWARVLANPILARILAVYNWVFGLFRATVPNWRVIVTGAKLLRQGVGNLGFEVYNTLYWIRNVWVPKMTAAARDLAILSAIAFVNKVLVPVTKSIVDLRLWALGRLAAASASLEALRRFTARELAALASTLSKVARRVLVDWATPTRLAAWLAGAMWSALWRYGFSQVDRFSDYFWRRRQAIILRTIGEIERQVGRLL
jgi:hypothetical protein